MITEIWLIGGEDIDKFFWAPGEPNNMGGGENCINLNPADNYRWNDETCDRVDNVDISYFICQWGKSALR